MCQPGWEGSLGENGYMYIYGWVLLLFTWNYHNIVNWLYPNTKLKVKKKKTTTTLISCLSRLFPWGSYLVLCIVNKWIRNSDKCCFPSQCERKRACCQEEEVTDQLQIWLQLEDGAPANIPRFMLPTTTWATAPHQPGRLERVTQSHRTRKFCFFKH